ncbi:DegT/DnrJ/EryC1/StrS family aminotransferase [Egicoccus sp. AB-alg2]|uniref:DegT/DnrJ/EryC1/StrS family aminotransferase n=1 Tax=Egicoccus sp. AB-alg2 TaxID=3242693 RepID=UPI00359DD19B
MTMSSGSAESVATPAPFRPDEAMPLRQPGVGRAAATGVPPVRFVDLQAEYRELQGEIDAALAQVIQCAEFVLGRPVAEFENAFARYCETAHAVGVDSGFSALELALRAFGVGPGDEVITAANTFYATVAAIISCGATPVLVDADPETATLDVHALERAITPATRAIVPVHLYGHAADMAPIVELAHVHGLRVLEDACQAHGGRYRGRRTGGLGDAAAFSFYPSKNLGAFGDGGMVVTDDEEVADRLRLLRNLGAPEPNQHQIRGYNRRLDGLQAAVLMAKLPWLDHRNVQRQRLAARYAQQLAGLPVVLPNTAPWAEHVFHLYVVRAPDRDRVRALLTGAGVETGIHYPVPIHLQRAHADLGYLPGDFPVAETLSREILSLPMHPALTDGDVDRVADALAAAF